MCLWEHADEVSFRTSNLPLQCIFPGIRAFIIILCTHMLKCFRGSLNTQHTKLQACDTHTRQATCVSTFTLGCYLRRDSMKPRCRNAARVMAWGDPAHQSRTCVPCRGRHFYQSRRQMAPSNHSASLLGYWLEPHSLDLNASSHVLSYCKNKSM